jgi:hypothetical protein
MQHNRKNDPSLWELQEHRWYYILRIETVKMEAQQFTKKNFKRFVMATWVETHKVIN